MGKSTISMAIFNSKLFVSHEHLHFCWGFLAMLRHILTTKHSLLTPSFTFTDYGTQILKTMNRKSNYIHIYIYDVILYTVIFLVFLSGFSVDVLVFYLFFCAFSGCQLFFYCFFHLFSLVLHCFSLFLFFLWVFNVFLAFFGFICFSLVFQCVELFCLRTIKKNSNSQIAYFDKPWHLWN